ncbi:protein longifolia 1 [Tanacetum coccineum]
MGKTSKFFKSLFGFKPSNPKRLGWTLFKSSHKQHNHDEAISADGGSVQSRPPSVVAKLMGLEALPDSTTTNQKQETGVTPISPPFCEVASKVLTLFKSSHKQHNHDEAISADGGSVQSRPPSVVAKLMGLEALPDSTTPNQKQETGVTPISPPFCEVASKVLTLFKSSHKQHNHDEAISAESVPSRPPSVVVKLMGLEALPDSATTTQKQEMGVTPISPPFYAVTSKVNVSMRRVPFTLAKRESSRRCLSGYSDHPNYMSHTESSRAKLRSISAPGGRRRSKYSNVQPNDDQHREAVVELKKATYRGTQVSREVSLTERVSYDSIQVIKDQWEFPDDVIPNTLSFGVSSEINRQKMQNIEHLPDDRYIFEILLASGLLLRVLGSSLTTFEFHSSGHPINPELFLVLEQTKFSNLPKQEPLNKKLLNKEKFHRKLIFDIVNEVLAKKLALVVPSLKTFSSKPFKLANKTLNGQKLLRDLCMEIEELLQVKKKKDVSLHEEDDGLKTILWEEELNRAESWTDYDGELPVIALELERLIFEDLVNEIVLVEASHGKRIQPERCRIRLSLK